MSLWMAFTLLATFMQAWRNAMQSKLGQQVDVLGVALSRFILAWPLSMVYLFCLYQWQAQPLPTPSFAFFAFSIAAAIMQIGATSLMIILFKQNNFAVGAGLAKSEALLAAILGVLFFSTQLNLLAWFGVIVGAVGVFLLSCVGNWRQLSTKTLVIGLGCGCGFALTSLWVREASHHTGLTFPFSAAWCLVWVLTVQTLIMTTYLAIRSPNTLRDLWQHRRLTALISTFSCIGSIGWFSAMALQSVPYVKTLGQIEIFFTMMISTWWLKQKMNRKDSLGLILVALAAVMVMWPTAT